MCPNTIDQIPTEIRPRMLKLKDYLLEDLNSCSSTGFKSFPRKPPLSDYAARRWTPINVARPNNGPRKLQIRRPSKVASTTISAFRAMINAVKNIQFVKSPSVILPRARSLSRSLSRRSSTKKNKNREQNLNVHQVKITVKDIMRWTSFRDINVEQHSRLSDFASTPDHHCTATTTTTTSSSCTCSSSGSSWCDSDFTAEDLPSWSGNCEADDGENENDVVDKKYLPAIYKEYYEDATTAYTVEPKVEARCEEERHEQSPITVLHHEFEEDEESLSSLDQSLVNFERTKEKLMQNIRRLESPANEEEEERYSNLVEDQQEEFIRDGEIEENNAWKLLEQVKTISSLDTVEQLVLFDFFRDELGRHPGLETEMVIRKAKAWVRGEHRTLFELGVDDDENKRKAFVNDLYMEGRGRWSGEFGEEQNELVMEVENDLLCDLVDQLLFDILL